jgi:hypothetical protein
MENISTQDAKTGQSRQDVIDRTTESRAYKLSPAFAALVMAGVVAIGIGKGLSDESNHPPTKPDKQVTVVIEDPGQ